MRATVPMTLLALTALTGCAANPHVLGTEIRNAESMTEICRVEVGNRLYGGKAVQLVGPPAYLTRPGLRAVTINVLSGPRATPEGWHCLFNAEGQMLSMAPGDAQARGDYLY